MDEDLQHDSLNQYRDENVMEEMEVEAMTDSAEVNPAEASAVNSDNETAREATGMLSEISDAEEAELEAEAEIVEEALEKKHKNRESTSEKAKKAATERMSKGESQTAQPVSLKKLDPLRLRGKKYRAVIGEIAKEATYPVEEAVALVKKTSTATFDASVELHAKVKTEATRGTVVLPHGTGKTKKVAVADDATIEAIAAGKLDFEVLLATPAQMPKLAKFAKILGPKGLMPSPKAGTVTEDIEKVQAEISGGRIEYRADKNGVVHASIGKVSFTDQQLVENYQALEQVLQSAKIVAISLASTMGPGVRVVLTK